MRRLAWLCSLFALMLFNSCMNEFDFSEAHGDIEVIKLKNEYDAAFAEEFGEMGVCHIDTEHKWGFGELEVNEIPAPTRSVNPNSNQWQEYVDVPPEITDEERDYVYNYFKNDNSTTGLNINWSDLFIQHVYKGTDSYVAENGQSVIGGNQMDYMFCGDEHVYNFNNSNGSIMLIQNGSTETFSYHNSLDSKRHYQYKILYIRGYGYYVGFDFKADGYNSNMKVAEDGVYTDWIVKVSPATYKGNMRIMCEDLGSIGDFDFNDCVFDAAYVREYWPVNGLFAVITLRAAGGTMPLYVGKDEVHEMFGVPVKTMVNSKSGSVERPVVVFRMQVETSNPIDIPILVHNTGSAKALNYLLDASEGAAPRKICVPQIVAWPDERQNIKERYPKFGQWVMNQENSFWE